MTSPRLVLLEQFFYPEGWGGAEFPRDLALHLAAVGYRIEVICGTEQYSPVEAGGIDPRTAGVRILRVRALPANKAVRSRRALRQAWFCGWALMRLLFRKPPDVFISQTNPPPVLPLVAFAAWLWRKPFLLIAMDLYPEVLFADGTINSRSILGRSVSAAFRWAYRSATTVVALGPMMADRIRAKGVAASRVLQTSNWATGTPGAVRADGNRLRAELGLQRSFVLLYSGNLGRGHEFDTLLRGISMARRWMPALKLVFFADGALLGGARQLARDLELESCVNFYSLVPADRLPETFGLADLGVVTLRDGFEGLMVPSKMAGYMARSIPVLYVGPKSDVDLLISSHRCGFSIRNGDVEAVAQAILEALTNPELLCDMGNAGRQAYENYMAREHALAKYETAVRDCLEHGRA